MSVRKLQNALRNSARLRWGLGLVLGLGAGLGQKFAICAGAILKFAARFANCAD